MDYSSLIRSPNAAALFFLILRETDNGKREFAMSYTEIGKALGLTRQQARWYLDVLERNGYISVPHTFHTLSTHLTNYRLMSCSVSKNTFHTLSTHFEGDIPKQEIISQFETLWTAYKRKGSKKIALRRWLMLTAEERAEALIHAPIYRNTRQTRFCKDLEAYLNQKAWESAITTDYGLELDPREIRILADEKRFGFYDYYNNKVQGTLIPTVEGDPEERRVLVNIVFSYFPWERIEAVIDKAVQDPYNSGALPLSAGKHVQTFEEIMHPNNILKANE